MENNETMVLYITHYETIKKLPESDQLLILKSIIEYGFYDIEPQLDGVSEIIFMMAKPNIDASKRRRKQARANGLKGASHGQKGGRPKNTETPMGVIPETPTGVISKTPMGVILKTPKKPLNVNVNVNVKENVNENVNENEKENKITPEGVKKRKSLEGVNAEQEKQQQVSGAAAVPFTRWGRAELAKSIEPFVKTYGREMCNQFFGYWAEPTASGKLRVNLEKAFDVSRRLSTWTRNNKGSVAEMPLQNFKTKQEAEQWVVDTYYHGRRELSALGMGISLTDDNNQPRPIEDIRKDVEHHMTSYQS